MKTLLSDSMQCPRNLDASTVRYRYPITSAGNETIPTRTRIDGYRSKPVKLTSRSISVLGSFRDRANTSGVFSIYVWKKATTIATKDAQVTPRVDLSIIGDRYFGELIISPNSVAGNTFQSDFVFDEDVDFVQIYTTFDLVAVTLLEGDGSGTVVHLIRPRALDELLTIADDFELTAPSSPVLIADPFSIGSLTDPAVGDALT